MHIVENTTDVPAHMALLIADLADWSCVTPMKLATWNVNSVGRACLRHGEWLAPIPVDALVLQRPS